MLLNDKPILNAGKLSRWSKKVFTLNLLMVLMSCFLVNGSNISTQGTLTLPSSEGTILNGRVQGEEVKRVFLLNYELSKNQFSYSKDSGWNISLDLEKRKTSIRGRKQALSINYTKKAPRFSLPSKGFIALITLFNLMRGTDGGALLCAACVTGCCAALGQIEGPVCVLHCSGGPCFALCCSPTP